MSDQANYDKLLILRGFIMSDFEDMREMISQRETMLLKKIDAYLASLKREMDMMDAWSDKEESKREALHGI